MGKTVVIEGDLALNTQICGEMDQVLMVDGSGGTRDHTALFNRDKPDQHPIAAITRLRGELDVRPDTEITPQDIDKIIYGE